MVDRVAVGGTVTIKDSIGLLSSASVALVPMVLEGLEDSWVEE